MVDPSFEDGYRVSSRVGRSQFFSWSYRYDVREDVSPILVSDDLRGSEFPPFTKIPKAKYSEMS